MTVIGITTGHKSVDNDADDDDDDDDLADKVHKC